MTFDESKHTRGGEGTKEGGKFIAKGQGGTPTSDEPVVAHQAVPGHEIGRSGTGEALPARPSGNEPPPLPGQQKTGEAPSAAKTARKVEASVEKMRPWLQAEGGEEKVEAYREMLSASYTSKEFRRQAGMANKDALVLLKYAGMETGPGKKNAILRHAEKAVGDAQAMSKKYIEALQDFVAKRDAYFARKASGKPDGQGAGSAQKQGGA